MGHIRLKKLPTNACWVFVLGDSLVTMEPRGSRMRTLFATHAEAVDVARDCGLSVDARGFVS